MIRQCIAHYVSRKISEIKRRRANAELEASMAHRLKRTQPRDARGRYMRMGGRATWKNSRAV